MGDTSFSLRVNILEFNFEFVTMINSVDNAGASVDYDKNQ